MNLPIDRNTFTDLHKAELMSMEDGWIVALRGYETRFRPSQLRFELGEPGEAKGISPK